MVTGNRDNSNVNMCIRCHKLTWAEWFCARRCVCAAVERQRVSVCVKVKYRWRRPECVRVSEVQCNCRQSQPYLPVKNTIIPHSPSQAISPVSSSLTLFLSPSLSLYLQLQPRGLFLSRTKTFPTSPPSPSLSLSILSTILSLSHSFPLLRVGEWKWRSCTHTPLIAVDAAVVYLFISWIVVR